MKEFIRIMSITIEGIKNVCHGSIKINNINEIESEEFLEKGSILGIYGQMVQENLLFLKLQIF